MIIPDSFKQSIANTFYDKEITKYTTEEVVDDEGWVGMEETVVSDSNYVSGTFMGNVRFDNLAQIQEDYGLKEVVDIVVTTDEDIDVNSIIGYENVLYRVNKAIPFDSHKLLIGNIWSSKSSISISA